VGNDGYCVNVKNITVTLDDETYRRARVKAAEQDTSVSAIVKKFLTEFAVEEGEFERLKRLEADVRSRIKGFSAAHNVPRDELYERGR
jgi:plasmid stability protein